MAYIAHLRFHGGMERPMRFAWEGQGNPEVAWKETQEYVNRAVGPNAKDQDDFVKTAREAFKKAGFVEVRA